MEVKCHCCGHYFSVCVHIFWYIWKEGGSEDVSGSPMVGVFIVVCILISHCHLSCVDGDGILQHIQWLPYSWENGACRQEAFLNVLLNMYFISCWRDTDMRHIAAYSTLSKTLYKHSPYFLALYMSQAVAGWHGLGDQWLLWLQTNLPWQAWPSLLIFLLFKEACFQTYRWCHFQFSIFTCYWGPSFWGKILILACVVALWAFLSTTLLGWWWAVTSFSRCLVRVTLLGGNICSNWKWYLEEEFLWRKEGGEAGDSHSLIYSVWGSSGKQLLPFSVFFMMGILAPAEEHSPHYFFPWKGCLTDSAPGDTHSYIDGMVPPWLLPGPVHSFKHQHLWTLYLCEGRWAPDGAFTAWHIFSDMPCLLAFCPLYSNVLLKAAGDVILLCMYFCTW